MTHEELKKVDDNFIEKDGWSELYLSINIKLNVFIYGLVSVEKIFYNNEPIEEIEIGSNFTPESLKQLINILKKAQ
jgi:hypothetical protein